MELKVYDGEYFERGRYWYIIFSFVILAVVILSVLSNNIIGGVIVLVFAAGYLYFSLKTNKGTVIIIGKKALQIGTVPYQWGELKGFVLEYQTKKKENHNIVIIDRKNYPRIYTVRDSNKNLEGFINELNGYIPMLEKYDQSGFEKFIRRIKL